MGIYIIMTLAVIGTAIVILSFAAPNESSSRFWLIIKKVRNILDLVSYWIINLLAIGTILTLVVTILYAIWQAMN